MKILDFINENKDKKINVYSDMDGVFAEYDIGNFDYSTIRPINTSIQFLKAINEISNINLYVLSVCKTNKIVNDKIKWFDKYMKFLNKDNAILLSKEEYPSKKSKELKYEYLEKHKNEAFVNILIDDDIGIIKYIKDKDSDIKVYHVSSIIK